MTVLQKFTKWKIELIVFAMFFLAGAVFDHPIEYDNTTSRYALLSAVVNDGTLKIDAYHAHTMDKSEFNGHYFSNKAPGASFLGIPIYWSLRHFASAKTFGIVAWPDTYIIRLITTTLLFAVLGIVMYRLAQFCGALPRQALLMVIAYGFGSIALLHATLFSGHQIAASLSFFSFALLTRSSSNHPTTATKSYCYGFWAGLFMGFAVLTDYTAIVISALLALYVISWRFNKELKTGFIFGACVCVMILGAYNTACFGHPLSLSYGHQVIEEFREGSSSGILGISLPKIKPMLHLLLSPARGIFFIMPVLILSFWGLSHMIIRQNRTREALVILLIVIVSFLFVSGFYGWHGGWTFGPRYLVPMLPFLAFPIAFLRWPSYPFWCLLIVSFAQIYLPIIGVPHVHPSITNPIVEFIIPSINNGYTSLHAGMLLGVGWLWTVLVTTIFICLLGIWAFRKTYQVNTPAAGKISFLSLSFLVFWMGIIIATLAFARTDASIDVHQLKFQALEHLSIFFNNQGIAYCEKGQHELAIKEFEKAIQKNPNHADSYRHRGLAYFKLGEYQLAINDFSKTLQLKPDDAQSYYHRGSGYENLGQYQSAIDDYSQAILLKKDYIDAYNNRGGIYFKLGQNQRAIRDYSEAIRLKHDYAEAYNNRAFVYLNQGMKDIGCADARKACELKNCRILDGAKIRGLCP